MIPCLNSLQAKGAGAWLAPPSCLLHLLCSLCRIGGSYATTDLQDQLDHLQRGIDDEVLAPLRRWQDGLAVARVSSYSPALLKTINMMTMLSFGFVFIHVLHFIGSLVVL